MSVNLIMFVAMYPMMMIVCFVMYTSMKPKNGIAFGSKVSAERMKDESLKEIERQWAVEMKRNILIAAALPLTAFLSPYASIQITIWTMWCFVLIVLLEYPFVKANARVKELKRSKGWYDPKRTEEYIELKSAGDIRRVKIKTFLLPFVVSMIAAVIIYGLAFVPNEMIKNAGYLQSFSVMVLLFALLNLMFLWMAQWMDRQKTEVISTKSDVNVNYARAKKNIWKDLWLQSSWITTAYVWMFAFSLLLQMELMILWGSVIYSVGLILLIIPMIKKLREVDARYEKERDMEEAGDDDRYWIWGMIYYNPMDKHSMVTQRHGMGTTFNMATKVGKVWAVVGVIGVFICPILCGWLIFEEFTPISLSISGDEIHANHLKNEYELPIEEIETFELVEELPKMTKSVGSAMETLRKGRFIVRGTGEKCELFLNPQNEVFLKIEMEGKIYYLGGRTDEETMKVYEALLFT